MCIRDSLCLASHGADHAVLHQKRLRIQNVLHCKHSSAVIPVSYTHLDVYKRQVHTFVELHLIRRVGDVGKKLHTARSRNDQCNVDMKLYVKQQAHHCLLYTSRCV